MMKVSKQYKYQAIADDIKTEIFSKHMKGNSPLPSIRQYAVKYGVTSNTIVSALHLLRNNKIIYPCLLYTSDAADEATHTVQRDTVLLQILRKGDWPSLMS